MPLAYSFEYLKWVYVGDKVNNGLRLRRAKEANIIQAFKIIYIFTKESSNKFSLVLVLRGLFAPFLFIASQNYKALI